MLAARDRLTLLRGLVEPSPDAAPDSREIVIAFDRRGVTTGATGDIPGLDGRPIPRVRDEARALLDLLEVLAASGLVVLRTECHENGRRARVTARISERGLDYLEAQRERVLAASGGD